MSLKDAFNQLLGVHNRTVTFTRIPSSGPNITGTLKVTPSNYFRNLEGPANVVIEGREFVISKDNLSISGVTNIRRGDRLSDSELGDMTIDIVREVFDVGGSIIGWRITTR